MHACLSTPAVWVSCYRPSPSSLPPNQVEIFKRKSPRLFTFIAFVMVILNEGLYVYDLYTDVMVIRFFYFNGYMWAAGLSIFFVINHYVILSGLLTYWMRDSLMGLIRRDEEEEEMALLEKAAVARKRPGNSVANR